MKNINGLIVTVANAGLLSLLSFPAIAESSKPNTLEKLVKANVEKRHAEEENKFTHIASLAGSKHDELMARRDETAITYSNLNDLKANIVKHYPTYQDFKAFEMAAKAYWHANKALIDLQKSILAQNGVPDRVATRLITMQ